MIYVYLLAYFLSDFHNDRVTDMNHCLKSLTNHAMKKFNI